MRSIQSRMFSKTPNGSFTSKSYYLNVLSRYAGSGSTQSTPDTPEVDPAVARISKEREAVKHMQARSESYFDNPDLEQSSRAIQVAKAWLDSGKTFMLLLGTPGAGKTLASVATMARLMTCYGESWNGLVVRRKDLKRCFTDAVFMDRVLGVRYLLLDDIGIKGISDSMATLIYEIVEERERLQRKTIITSNGTPEQFFEVYDSRIESRILGDGVIETFDEKDSKDYRIARKEWNA